MWVCQGVARRAGERVESSKYMHMPKGSLHVHLSCQIKLMTWFTNTWMQNLRPTSETVIAYGTIMTEFGCQTSMTDVASMRWSGHVMSASREL
jgi:hypothetical protein